MKMFKSLYNVFRRSKRAMIINVLGLSVAFAAFLIILMQVYFDRSFDACHKDAKRIYRVELGIQGNKFAIVSRPITEFIAQSPQIEASALATSTIVNTPYKVDHNNVENRYNERTQRVTPSFADVFHFDILDGTDKALSLPDHVLIPASLAKKIFGDDSAVGKQLEEESKSVIIGGVYKDFPKNSSIENVIYGSIPEKETGGWGDLKYNAYVKVIPSVDVAEERTRLESELVSTLKENEPNMPATNLYLTPLRDLHNTTDVMYDNTPKSNRQTATILLTIAFAIIIVAGINYMNMSMALVPKRMKSININRVLGGTNASIRTNYILESVVIGLFSFLIGLVFVFLVSKTSIVSLIDADINFWMHPGLVMVTLVIALSIGALSGLYPSFYITSFQPALVLKGAFGMTIKAKNLRRVLIGVQFVTAFVLIMSSWFMYLQNGYLRHADVGYDRDQIILSGVNPRIVNSKNAFTDQLKSFAGIADVTYAASALSTADNYNGWNTQFNGEKIMFQWIPVDPSFIDVMNIEISEGRGFREDDKKTGKYIFNEKAKKEFGLTLNALIDSAEIIGFIPDIQYTTFHSMSAPMAFYVSSGQKDYTNFAYIKVKAGSNMKSAIEHVKSVVHQYENGEPLQVRFYDDIFNQVYEKEQSLTLLISLFSVIAIIISITGVLGLVFFENEYRQKEVGIRKVLGSSEMEVLALFNKSYLAILAVCFAIACVTVHYFISKWLENFSLQTPLYWWVFLVSGLLVVLITIVTVSWQSWSTATSNPLDTMKS
ncbi:MAG: FtsX-like permease family protein [Bacteroidales bacterium]